MMPNIHETDAYVTIRKGMSGWFACHIWWNPDGFWEPYDTGMGRYALKEFAIAEAREWANDLQLPFKE